MSPEWKNLDRGLVAVLQQYQDVAPVRLTDLAKALNVPVKAATLAPGISGEIRPDSDGKYVIRINRHDPKRRQRFSVAHEISHFLLHKDKIGEGIADNVLYRSNLSDKIEAEANRLAADILMPDSLVREQIEAANEKGVGDMVLYLADEFAVSEMAMRIKLENLGIIADA
jgi:hypothetical protein